MTPSTRPISTATFLSNTFTFDPLLAGECISQSANIAAGLNAAGVPLPRGTVLYGPALNAPITTATLLTTATGAGNARCILAADIDTSGGQVTGLVYTSGKFLDTAMIFTAAGAASDAASLWDYGIYVLTVEGRSGQLIPMMKLPATGGAIPNSLGAKAAAETLKEEVEVIKNAPAAYPAGKVPTPAVHAPTSQGPAWAIAAFGEAKPSPEDEARLKAAETADEMAEKQQKALDELKAKQSEELGKLLQKQSEERQKFEEQEADREAKAREKEAKEHPQPMPYAAPVARGEAAPHEKHPSEHLPASDKPKSKQ